MSNISASQVKELREKTGVGMMECKSALVETGGDLEKAIIWLRERGMSRAAKKAGRTAAEGLVELAINGAKNKAIALEVNSETDFAAKNETFVAFVKAAAQIALDKNVQTIEQLAESPMNGSTVGEQLTNLIATVGENMQLRRLKSIVVDGIISDYVHMGGKIGCLVAMKGADSAKGHDIGKDIAMHIAASAPKYLNKDFVDTKELDQEREIARKKLLEEGKPEAMIDKILSGQMNKFYNEVCLVDQPFVKDPKVTVSQFVKQSGLSLELVDFVRFQLGEGIEKKEENFAEEVAAQLKK
jgi:elongation factor Ts